MEQRININKKYIQINSQILLKNYWYRYVSHLIQLALVEEEDLFLQTLGEDKYEYYFDWIESCVDKSTQSENTELEIPNEIDSIGKAIEEIVLGEGSSWLMGEIECNLDKEKINKWSSDYFKNLIIPYLQMEKEKLIILEGESDRTNDLFRLYFKQYGYNCVERVKKCEEIKSIAINNENTVIISWIEEREFIVNADLLGELPVEVIIETTAGRYVKRKVSICFPWYKKSDHVIVNVLNNENRWMIISKNLNNNFEYVSEMTL